MTCIGLASYRYSVGWLNMSETRHAVVHSLEGCAVRLCRDPTTPAQRLACATGKARVLRRCFAQVRRFRLAWNRPTRRLRSSDANLVSAPSNDRGTRPSCSGACARRSTQPIASRRSARRAAGCAAGNRQSARGHILDHVPRARRHTADDDAHLQPRVRRRRLTVNFTGRFDVGCPLLVVT